MKVFSRWWDVFLDIGTTAMIGADVFILAQQPHGKELWAIALTMSLLIVMRAHYYYRRSKLLESLAAFYIDKTNHL